MKDKILKSILVVWIVLWLFFINRELFRKGYFYDYRALASRTLDGKRSYVTGDRFYEFLTFSKDRLGHGATFDLIGVKEGSIDIRRAVYYLYPALRKSQPEYILVYDEANSARAGYETFARLDETRYILKERRRGQGWN